MKTSCRNPEIASQVCEQPGLFVYGTLHPDRAPAEIHGLVTQFRLCGSGMVLGELLDLGEYPGLILHGEQSAVPGEVFALTGLEMLRAIDAYEGYDEADGAGSLFERKLLPVQMESGATEEHWAYVYNRGLPGAR